jgi:hypothetical protein
MDLKINLKSFTTPKTYTRLGLKTYLDPFRQMLVPLSSESLLLYKMEMYVHQVMGVPKNRMAIQQSLRKYGIDSTKVISIIVHDVVDGILTPVALVDCAAPGIPLSFATTTPLEEFAKAKNINYIIVTNGVEVDSYISRADRLSFWKIDNVPNYETICASHRELNATLDVTPPVTKTKAKSVVPEKMSRKEHPHTPIINALQEALKDSKNKLKAQKFSGIGIVGDCGKRKRGIKTNSDQVDTLLQRTFLVQDFHNNHQLMSIDIESNPNGIPNLSVTLDNLDNRQVIFSLDLHKDITLNDGQSELYIDLNTAFMVSGETFIEGLSHAIKEKLTDKSQPGTLQINAQNKLTFGHIPMGSALTCTQQEVASLLINLLAFALILDEYRENIKRAPRKAKK